MGKISTIPKGLDAYKQCIHLFILKGELEIVVERFLNSPHAGSYVYIPAKEVHDLRAIDEVDVYK